MFGCDIRADSRLRDQAGDRYVIDDCAAAALQHVRDLVFHAQKNAFQIDSQRLVESRFVHFSDHVGGSTPALLNAQCNPP